MMIDDCKVGRLDPKVPAVDPDRIRTRATDVSRMNPRRENPRIVRSDPDSFFLDLLQEQQETM